MVHVRHAELRVVYWDDRIQWQVTGWSGRTRRFYAHGILTPEEAAVVGDKLAAEGILTESLMTQLGEATAKALRYQAQQRGDVGRAEKIAASLRQAGYAASSSDAYVFIPLVDAERLIEVLDVIR